MKKLLSLILLTTLYFLVPKAYADGSETPVVCTPVYGMHNCQRVDLADTGAQDSLAYTFSALSYLAGLVSFIKTKKYQ